jgi:hypothetical protein
MKRGGAMNESVSEYLAKIGRKGGKVKSEEKAEAARENAKMPRPRKKKVRT